MDVCQTVCEYDFLLKYCRLGAVDRAIVDVRMELLYCESECLEIITALSQPANIVVSLGR